MDVVSTHQAKKRMWRPRKGLIPAFFLGLIVGPVMLSYFGVTVTSRTAAVTLRDGVVQYQAEICEVQARAAVAEPARLDSGARRDLATKYSATHANGNTDYEIVGLCSSKLAT
jgi:hypothetical protein